jgi:hypothetical protein
MQKLPNHHQPYLKFRIDTRTGPIPNTCSVNWTVEQFDGVMRTTDFAKVIGSGAAQLQLEPGDTIYALDGMRLNDLGELERHHSSTSIDFINICTNAAQRGQAELPPP